MDMKLFLVTLMISCTTDAYNILIIQPGPTFSQQQPALGLAEILVKKGHNVFAVALNEVPVSFIFEISSQLAGNRVIVLIP